MNEDEFAELAAGYALDALSPADRAVFEAERRRHPEWEHWVSAFTATAASLADGIEDVAPPPTVRSSLLARIGAEPQLSTLAEPSSTDRDHVGVDTRPSEETRPADDAPDRPEDPVPVAAAPRTTDVPPTPTRRRWTRGLFALAASVVLLTVIGFGAVSIIDAVNRPPAVVALDEIEAAPDASTATVDVTGGGTATAHWAPSVGKVVLVADGLPRIPEDEVFELWWVRDGEPESAGTFETGTDGSSTVLLNGQWQAEDVIAVTVEPDGGAPEGVPTSDPILAIPTT